MEDLVADLRGPPGPPGVGKPGKTGAQGIQGPQGSAMPEIYMSYNICDFYIKCQHRAIFCLIELLSSYTRERLKLAEMF